MDILITVVTEEINEGYSLEVFDGECESIEECLENINSMYKNPSIVSIIIR